MKLLVMFAALCASCLAQNAVLPSHWVGAGVGYNAFGSPKATAWGSQAILLSQASQSYSYSTYDMIQVKGQVPMISLRTGVATVLRRFDKLTVLGLGTVGVSQTASATTAAFSGGALGVYQFSSGFTMELGARTIKAGSISQRVYEFGFGRVW